MIIWRLPDIILREYFLRRSIIVDVFVQSKQHCSYYVPRSEENQYYIWKLSKITAWNVKVILNSFFDGIVRIRKKMVGKNEDRHVCSSSGWVSLIKVRSREKTNEIITILFVLWQLFIFIDHVLNKKISLFTSVSTDILQGFYYWILCHM